MNNLISILCKSYKGDLKRVIELSKSINQYNKDNIPFYISVPPYDIELFEKEIPYYTKILDDSSITNNYEGWVGQQYVKSFFYKTKLSKFYLIIDSDSYFIKNFYISDFLVDEETPYMVMSQHEDMLNWTDRYSRETLPFNPRDSFEKDYNIIKSKLNRQSKTYHFGPTPCIWNCEVWEKADNKFGIDNLLKLKPTEIKWYGELVLHQKRNYLPIPPLFKVFHYSQQYSFHKQLGWEEKDWDKQYFGIILQSNWDAPLKY